MKNKLRAIWLFIKFCLLNNCPKCGSNDTDDMTSISYKIKDLGMGNTLICNKYGYTC